ncbi:MAG: hypothetical protein ABGW77_05950 [Campylobacterales bacterium]
MEPKFTLFIFKFLFLPAILAGDPVTPYDLYLFNFGDCVLSCADQNMSKQVCKSRCWQIWKFFLQPQYQLVNGVLVKVTSSNK